MLDEGGVTLIEWGDTIIPALPADYLEVRLRLGEGDDDRVLELAARRARAGRPARGRSRTALAPVDRPGRRDARRRAATVDAAEPSC